ncbi:RecU Holliday junction resolvase [Mycoplasmopsis meleagridis]|uniref:Holliday junction resolvase RecU n=1 Tax=Mycoplasmopsis meleagridis ATCC 25294 TaxID=1264554 RepID=A0A0F5H0L1_9BACT|nr:Holliday junction resolvase RecU [Mycoplasmopsis meleagridis]KKB26665.1 RecU Holliday junction resolvase [Mycoplasmopsis meleagridis ATCC 25294]KUH47633.1 Holliday junction resolvase RecU [Mycoplasmopsis meleagridis]OAD18220.1 hypothetical protein MM26B8_05280 [Mycoplasmopsis meleagridis]OAD18421.1 RecU Holliday junction resolvase [Mycoplasmopsis meleagridis]VEU77719.1 penicillin-binding protein-related factor A recombinase [Mycoplasmopsis meleagridis]
MNTYLKNRGMLLETIINKTIDYYERNKIAYIEKKMLPVKFKKVNEKGELSEARIYNKSTVDYIGCFKGNFVAFEAKSTNEKYLPKNNIKKHQVKYLEKINNNGGISFLIIFFSIFDEFYFVKYENIRDFLNKKISYEIIKKQGINLELSFPGIIDFIPCIS